MKNIYQEKIDYIHKVAKKAFREGDLMLDESGITDAILTTFQQIQRARDKEIIKKLNNDKNNWWEDKASDSYKAGFSYALHLIKSLSNEGNK